MSIKLKAILAMIFFGVGFVVAYLEVENGVLGYYSVGIPFLKAVENYVLIILYGLIFLFAMALAFGKTPKGARGVYTITTVFFLVVYGYELYNEISMGLFFMGGGNLNVFYAIFLVVGMFLAFGLLTSMRRAKRIKE